MSALARVLKQKGIAVSGSDMKSSTLTKELEKEGMEISSGHHAKHVPTDATVIYSTAISNENPEYAKALEQKMAVLHRSELLNRLLYGYQMLAVTGTHGKTTTSALLTWVLKFAGRDPSFAIGGLVEGKNGGHGTGSYFVAEACESDGTFLKYDPSAVILTSTDPDHLDYWENEQRLRGAYEAFAKKADVLLWCKDDCHAFEKGRSYGFTSGSDIHLKRFRQKSTHLLVDMDMDGTCYDDIQIAALGKHNALNGVAVFALCLSLGVEEDLIRMGLKSFPGVSRRQEIIGESQGLLVIDDYAHHPKEIKATLKALKMAYPERRLVTLFQPHRHSRLGAHFDTFAKSFDLADCSFICPVYSAGEEGTCRAKELCLASKSTYLSDLHHIKEHLRPLDLFVTLGAGDITEFSRSVLEDLRLPKLKVALMYGGESPEHAISVKSAKNIAQSINPELFEIEHCYIPENGEVSLEETEKLKSCDIAFPIFHGPNGEDGLLQGFLETLKIPFVGCDFKSSAVCMDKIWAKQIAKAENIQVAPFTHFEASEWKTCPESVIGRIEKLKFPLWVKAAHLGSSIGMCKVEHAEDLQTAIDSVIACDSRFIVEEHIQGRELEVAVLGNRDPIATHPGEILLGGAFYSSEKKYDPNTQTRSRADLPKETADKAKEMAVALFRLLGCEGWVRIDFLMDENSQLFFSEANPIPGCTPTSLYPQMCAEIGISFQELLTRLISLGLSKHYATV